MQLRGWSHAPRVGCIAARIARARDRRSWLEEFGEHLLKENWLLPAEMETWNMGGFYRRDLGDGLCAIILNSNSWTAQQVMRLCRVFSHRTAG